VKARALLAPAGEAEVAEFLAQYRGEQDLIETLHARGARNLENVDRPVDVYLGVLEEARAITPPKVVRRIAGLGAREGNLFRPERDGKELAEIRDAANRAGRLADRPSYG